MIYKNPFNSFAHIELENRAEKKFLHERETGLSSDAEIKNVNKIRARFFFYMFFQFLSKTRDIMRIIF